MQVCAKIHIDGVVQGVGFRFYAHREANALGLTGYVKNLADGSVFCEVEGERGFIEDYIKALKIGPSYAHVTLVTTEWEQYTGRFRSFRVAF